MSESVDQYRHNTQDNFQSTDDPHSNDDGNVVRPGPSPSDRIKITAENGIEYDDSSANPTATDNPEIDPNLTFEEELERELALSTNSDGPEDNLTTDDPYKRFQKSCMDLVNKAREETGREIPEHLDEQFTASNPGYDASEDAASLYHMDRQFQEQDLPQTAELPKEAVALGRPRPRSLATGMTVVLLAIGMTGAFLDVHEHPLVLKSIPWGAESAEGSNGVKANTVPVTPSDANSSKIQAETAARSDRLLIASANGPVVPVPETSAKSSERLTLASGSGTGVSDLDERQAVLRVNLKMTEAYLVRLKQSIQNAKPNEAEPLLVEASDVQNEIDNLKRELLALNPETGVVGKSAEKVAVNAFAPIDEKPEAATAAIAAALVKPESETSLSENIKPRNPAQVELAMSATPGLKLLDSLQRERLKQQLVAGECLVPALRGVFPQVPVLVMRDLVQQLEEGC